MVLSGLDVSPTGEQVDSTLIDRIHTALRKHSALEELTDAIECSTWVTDRTGRFIRANQSWYRRHGLDPSINVAGQTAHGLLDAVAAAKDVSETLAVLDSRKSSVSVSTEPGSLTRTVRVPIIDSGEVIGVICSAVDQVTGDPNAKNVVVAESDIDPLTGAHNLDALHLHVAEVLATGEDSAVLLIDLDDFHVVSDSLGHAMADQYLVAASRRLIKVFGVRLFRIGGDKFVVILPTSDKGQLHAVADQILTRWHKPLVIDGTEIYGGVSIGIAPIVGQPTSSLVIQDAEMALRKSKDEGKNRATVYDPAQRKIADESLGNQMLVRRAVTHKEFSLHWQPIFELSTGRISAVEALLRWQPNGGPQTHPAADFIPFLEASGLIQPVGKQALEQACLQYRGWNTNAKVGRSVPINFNLSRAQFGNDSSFAMDFLATLRSYDVPASDVTVEIADFSPGDNYGGFLEDLNRLSSAGVRIAIDDFGFGLSPIGLVAGLPISVTKIGRAFVGRIREGVDDPFLNMVQTAAESVGQDTIVQGVEDEIQLRWLRDRGWTHAQGYFLAKPMDATEMTAMLSRVKKD